MTALALVWRCADPYGNEGACSHYETRERWPGEDRSCVYRSDVLGCTHARARQEALRALLCEVLEIAEAPQITGGVSVVPLAGPYGRKVDCP